MHDNAPPPDPKPSPDPAPTAELHAIGLDALEAFREIDAEIVAHLTRRLRPKHIARGDVLLEQGAPARALYLVVSGRFEVTQAGRETPIAELGAGDPVGEIAFFGGGLRTATVRATRDSLVLRLKRADFERVSAEHPSLMHAIAAFLSRRLAATTERRSVPALRPARTIALIRAGATRLAPELAERLAAAMAAHGSVLLARREDLASLTRGLALESPEATAALNALEQRHDTVLYLADDEASPWSLKILRQADVVLMVGDAAAAASDADRTPNPLERAAMSMHRPANLRLVLRQATTGVAANTAFWLATREVALHHHVSLSSGESFARLARFLAGRAVGLVAAGGGAFCAAHIGLHRGLRGAGLRFDAYGGTSGGSAMAAAFALGVPAREIERRLLDIFVRRKAMRRWTWPRYALLDHQTLDDALRENYGSVDIRDLWAPYFAAAASLATGRLRILREGPLWEAIRASSAIPGLLPPFFARDGDVLVDGATIDNVPIRSMAELKSGPNAVLAFRAPPLPRTRIDYTDLPSRRRLLLSALLPGRSARLPGAPSARAVLMRALDIGRLDMASGVGPDDEVFMPPIPADMGALDWRRCHALIDEANRYAAQEAAARKRAGRPLFRVRGAPA
ncbi:cyclic nucleotide-binding and patatin-like phospholipase domain-containing protein [Albimonas sp. CAU 1670]|uniref:patatin-like phospholipase family protein n=1 Tax=Albimonas sp. CAU 1670 TaxID=3032599 RepID=UPI0023DA3DC5|nr:cyclic nucleotide-binding and patatin-like phospholipase domain-containing protein [Albimonas sp. CAU 1670]MDF2235332.1 cyclic nucleotide-binding and patatin-like phospholipase domain-containing protein [Albimonas sp. CAU 1670]